MSDVYRVTLDLQKIAANIAAAEGNPVSDQEVLALLAETGFVRSGDDWICEDVSLSTLCQGELLASRRLG